MSIYPRARSVIVVIAGAIALMGTSLVNAQTAPTPSQPVIIPPAGTVSAVTATATSRLEIDGTILALNGAQILVGGIQFDISRAQISRPLSTGLFVHVEAVLVNGIWQATEVDAERFASNLTGGPVASMTATPATPMPAPAATLLPAAHGQEIELYGVITLIEPGFITVGVQRIDIRRAELNLPSMGIGTIVKLHVTGMPGAYIAREVELIDNDDLNPAEMTAVLAGGLIVDFDRRDDRRGSSSNTVSNSSNNSNSNFSSNSSSNTSSNASSNTGSSYSSSNSNGDDRSGRSSDSGSGSGNSGHGSDDDHDDDRDSDDDD